MFGESMNYDKSYRTQKVDLSFAVLVAAIIVSGIVLVFAFQLLALSQISRGRTVLPAIVVGYEEHGYPEKTNDWLRVSFPQSRGGAARALIRAPRRYREFVPNEQISVLHRYVLSGNGRPMDDFTIDDIRFLWLEPLLRFGAALGGCIGLLYFRRRLRHRAMPLDSSTESNDGTKARTVGRSVWRAIGIYVLVWSLIFGLFIAYAKFMPDHGGLVQETANITASFLGGVCGVGFALLVCSKLGFSLGQRKHSRRSYYDEIEK
jgi:hypothetical protein